MAWKDTLRREIEKGGTETPCPRCQLPRVRRSDYIRCCACALNWMDGENLDKDPRQQRMNRFLRQCESLPASRHREDR